MLVNDCFSIKLLSQKSILVDFVVVGKTSSLPCLDIATSKSSIPDNYDKLKVIGGFYNGLSMKHMYAISYCKCGYHSSLYEMIFFRNIPCFISGSVL